MLAHLGYVAENYPVGFAHDVIVSLLSVWWDAAYNFGVGILKLGMSSKEFSALLIGICVCHVII